MKNPHSIKCAKNKSEDPECLADHILNLVGEGQDFMKTIMDGNKNEIYEMFSYHYSEILENDFMRKNLEQGQIELLHMLKGHLMAFRVSNNEIDNHLKDELKIYFERIYCPLFLGMDIKSFFVYTEIVKIIYSQVEE